MFLDPQWVQYTASAAFGGALTWATLRLTQINIWRANAEGYKAELERQKAEHDTQMTSMQAQLDAAVLRLELAEAEIKRLTSLTDVSPVLKVVPLIEEMHSTLVAKVPAAKIP